MFIRSIEKRTERSDDAYPFCLPLIRGFERFDFEAPATIFTGENGSGKTTLLSIIANKTNAINIGGGKKQGAEGLKKAASLFRVAMGSRPAHCFFFSAEDFTREIENRERMRREAEAELRNISSEYAGRDYARSLAAQPYARALGEMDARYENDLAARSHGEGYLDFFSARLAPKGLYILDEPEAALSYFNQLVLVNMIRDAMAEGSEFIMATHSPVLAACPGAALYELADGSLMRREYEDIECVKFLRMFFRDKDRLL